MRGWRLLRVVLVGVAGGAVAGHLAGRAFGRVTIARRPPTLAEETSRLRRELPLAESRKPYLVLDLTRSRLDFRISGATIRTVPFRIEGIRSPEGALEVTPGRLALLTLVDRGAPPEVIVPPDPDRPVDPLKDPKIFPPDPPTDFTLTFLEPVAIRIRGEGDLPIGRRFLGAATSLREWMPAVGSGGATRIRIDLPAERVREIYRAIYRGQKFLVIGIGAGNSPGS